MIRFILIIAIIVVVACRLNGVAGDDPDTAKSRTNPAPVSLAAEEIDTKPRSERTIVIQLTIRDDFEIYSQHDHELVMPLRPVLLNATLQPIKSTMEFPKPKTIPFDKAFGGDYHVYSGKPKLLARFAADQKPAYVSVFYQGYSKRGY